MPIVDTHAHIYHDDENEYPKIEQPFRPQIGVGTIEHLRKDVAQAGVERVVLVQTGSAYRWDNRLVGDVAAANSEWTVGVCNLDPAALQSVDKLEELVRDYNIKGLRLEPAGDLGFYHQGTVRLWEKVRELEAVVCAHIQSQHLGELAQLLESYPQVPVVLDHCAYPKGAEGVQSETAVEVAKLARFPQLYGKLTFGVTGSDQEYPFADTQPLIRHFIKAFGPQRCMWGSDFPCEHWLKKATYSQHLALFKEGLGLSQMEQEAILQEAPLKLWFGE
jgi:predicted TIM-barrel fold metal-dependent hydrolase